MIPAWNNMTNNSGKP